MSAFLNDVHIAGIHPGLILLNEIKTPVLEIFLTCIERDSLCYNIFVSLQELSCYHKPISNSKLTDPSASSGLHSLGKQNFINLLKLVLIIDTYCILILLTPKATARKRNELTRGTSLDRVDSEFVKRLIITLINWRESE